MDDSKKSDSSDDNPMKSRSRDLLDAALGSINSAIPKSLLNAIVQNDLVMQEHAIRMQSILGQNKNSDLMRNLYEQSMQIDAHLAQIRPTLNAFASGEITLLMADMLRPRDRMEYLPPAEPPVVRRAELEQELAIRDGILEDLIEVNTKLVQRVEDLEDEVVKLTDDNHQLRVMNGLEGSDE